jgi:hypothetical protein
VESSLIDIMHNDDSLQATVSLPTEGLSAQRIGDCLSTLGIMQVKACL